MVNQPEGNIGAYEYDIGIFTEVLQILDHPEGKEVEVRVIGPKAFPQAMREARAKLKAVRALGVADVATDTVKDIFANRRVERRTEVIDHSFITEADYIRQVTPQDILERFDPSVLIIQNFAVLVRDSGT